MAVRLSPSTIRGLLERFGDRPLSRAETLLNGRNVLPSLIASDLVAAKFDEGGEFLGYELTPAGRQALSEEEGK